MKTLKMTMPKMTMILTWVDRLAGWWLDSRRDQTINNDPELRKQLAEMGDFEFKKAEIGPDGFTLEGVSPVIAILAEEATAMLNRVGAKNYVQFDLLPRLDRGVKAIRITVQWAYGMSPGTKNARLAESLTALLEALKSHRINSEPLKAAIERAKYLVDDPLYTVELSK